MSLSDVLRLLARKWLLLVLVPLILGVSTYFFARHLPKTYSSDTTIYTGIASGYSLSGTAQTDYNSTSNAFDNLINIIKARSTKEEVIYQLLATHLWQTSQQPALLNTGAYTSLLEIPAELRRQLTAPTQEATLENVRRYALANTSNAIYKLLNSSNPTYSLAALNNLTAARIGSSDLIKLEFESYDPELCRYTLALATQVFLNQHRSLREGQTTSVIEYYEAELTRAKARLAKAESDNLAFNRDNNIINYDEQSKNVAAEREALATQLAQMNQEYAGAQAALQAINRKLGGRPLALLSSREVVEQRQKLSRLNAAIADQQLYSQQQEPGSADKTKQLQAEADKTVKSMLNSVDDYYTHNTSTEGISNKELLSEWMQDMVLVETSRAKLAVMNRRLQEFEHEYQRMAPLGATLKRIEREIDLAEKAYLSVLSSLNASKSSRQNTQLTATHLKIIDPPYLPLAPKTSKLMLLVLLSTVGGFVFTTGLVLALGLLDKSLKTPVVAAKRIGLPVAGIMLDTHIAPTKQLQASQQRSLDQLVRHILLKANTPPAPSPFVVGIFSVQRQEGKTTLCQALAQRCHEMGVQTLALYPDHDELNDTFDVPSLFYPSEAAAVQGWPLDQLIQHAVPKRMSVRSAPNIQIVLIEFPALREEALPVGVLRQLNLVFLTVPATRAWRLTDHQSVEYLRAATSAPVEVVLSGVAAHYGEEVFS
jgi:succinoglycan biosynthesis transport protein ExoP